MSLLFSAAALALVTTSPLPRGSIARGTGGRTGPLRMADGRTAVSSTASLPGTSPAAAYQTLASPANWPGLLLFCASAELVNGAKGGLLKKGATKCWGYNNYGQLGNGGKKPSDTLAPGVTLLLKNITQMSAGNGFTCAVIQDQSVRCWGRNTYGQLGLCTLLG